MRLRMLKLRVGKGRQVMKQLCLNSSYRARGVCALQSSIQREGMGLSFDKIATDLNIDQSTARRIFSLFSATGSVTKKSYDKANLPRKVTNVVQCFILQLVFAVGPVITLREIKSNVSLTLQDESTILQIPSISRIYKIKDADHNQTER